MTPRPASARPAATAAATARWVGFLAFVAVDGRRGDAGAAQLVVEQDAGARPALAVDVAHARQVGEAFDAERVAGGDDQTLLTMDEPDHLDRPPGHHALDPRQRVVAAVGVEQVAAREVAEAVA